jgi:ribonuclease P protein component
VIARDLRLRSERDFERVRSRGKAFASRLIVLRIAPNDLGHNRYGFAAGKRIGNAVQRNRAKRLMREAVRLKHLTLVQGHDVVFIARAGVLERDRLGDVSQEIEQLLRRSGLEREERTCDDHSSG